jgi:hypothetical protein
MIFCIRLPLPAAFRNRFLKRALLIIILITAAGGTAATADFGIVLAPTAEYTSDPKGMGFGFTGTLTPWFSAVLSKKTNFYLSGKAAFEYTYQGGEWIWPPLFELERTELNFRPARGAYLSFGRQPYRDSGGMIAAGLFDGVSGSLGLGRIRLSLGAFYTGFLYKKTAEILMTPEDRERYLKPLNYGDLDSYFASRRMFLPLDIEFPDLTSRLSLALTLLAQIDVNDAPALHTQYLETRLGVEAANTLRLAFTGIGALAESEDANVRAHLAAAFRMDWDLPGALTDMFSSELRWGGGAVSETIAPFTPISGIAQGTIFSSTLEGLMNLRAVYTARPLKAISFSGEAAAFWRTDVETFKDTDLDGASKDRFLGTEIYGSLIWVFQSAFRVTMGGGVFFPCGAFVKDANLRWKVNTGILLAL